MVMGMEDPRVFLMIKGMLLLLSFPPPSQLPYYGEDNAPILRLVNPISQKSEWRFNTLLVLLLSAVPIHSDVL